MPQRNEDYDFSQFQQSLDMDNLIDLMNKAESEGAGEFKHLPAGEYDVTVRSFSVRPRKKDGVPQAALSFKVEAGPYKGRTETYYERLYNANYPDNPLIGVGIVKRFIDKMDVVDPDEFRFGGDFNSFGKKLMKIGESCAAEGYHFKLTIGEKNGYSTYDIEAV